MAAWVVAQVRRVVPFATMNIADPMVRWAFGLLLAASKPGGSIYSFETVPECGTTKGAPTCELKPVCDEPSVLCRAPRWSDSRNAWVRNEAKPTAARRMLPIAVQTVLTARRMTACLDEEQGVLEDCKPIYWPGGTRAFVAALATIIGNESGSREDIEYGYPPNGRGPDGEVCLMQIMPTHIAFFAGPDATVDDLLGESNLGTCITAGAKILARKRVNAQHKCKGWAWDYATFAFYGTGNRCSSKDAEGKDWPLQRQTMYRAFLARKADAELPDWVKKALEPAT